MIHLLSLVHTNILCHNFVCTYMICTNTGQLCKPVLYTAVHVTDSTLYASVLAEQYRLGNFSALSLCDNFILFMSPETAMSNPYTIRPSSQ